MSCRCSSLDRAEKCSQSAMLDSGTSRAAPMSSAFHALQAGDKGAAQLFNALSAEEQAEIGTWHSVADVTVGDVLLQYSEAEKERWVGLDHRGNFADSGDIMAGGSLDMMWLLNGVAYIGDIKKGLRTSSCDSLQLAAYAFAVCAEFDCDGFYTGIWAAEEGEWRWNHYVDIESEEAVELLERIRHAATHDNGYTLGSYCGECYSRMNCREYVLPPELSETSLAPVAAGGAITTDNALELYTLIKRTEDTVKAAKAQLTHWVKTGGLLLNEDGTRRYALTEVQGRESTLSVAKMREIFGADAEQYIRKGAPHARAAWVKA